MSRKEVPIFVIIIILALAYFAIVQADAIKKGQDKIYQTNRSVIDLSQRLDLLQKSISGIDQDSQVENDAQSIPGLSEDQTQMLYGLPGSHTGKDSPKEYPDYSGEMKAKAPDGLPLSREPDCTPSYYYDQTGNMDIFMGWGDVYDLLCCRLSEIHTLNYMIATFPQDCVQGVVKFTIYEGSFEGIVKVNISGAGSIDWSSICINPGGLRLTPFRVAESDKQDPSGVFYTYIGGGN